MNVNNDGVDSLQPRHANSFVLQQPRRTGGLFLLIVVSCFTLLNAWHYYPNRVDIDEPATASSIAKAISDECVKSKLLEKKVDESLSLRSYLTNRELRELQSQCERSTILREQQKVIDAEYGKK
jgi:hypothetical protein